MFNAWVHENLLTFTALFDWTGRVARVLMKYGVEPSPDPAGPWPPSENTSEGMFILSREVRPPSPLLPCPRAS